MIKLVLEALRLGGGGGFPLPFYENGHFSFRRADERSEYRLSRW